MGRVAIYENQIRRIINLDSEQHLGVKNCAAKEYSAATLAVAKRFYNDDYKIEFIHYFIVQ